PRRSAPAPPPRRSERCASSSGYRLLIIGFAVADILACPASGVLAFAIMTRNTALKEPVPLPEALAGRSIALVGLMGAGKTSIGRRLAARLGLPFRDADAEIELAAGCTIPELFSRYGESDFR